ncbi:MAG: NifB/NifX family molybdenum-iron cluster-binding protein [Clostridiales bacterium]|nr:NifB/NifX family molybdenum-iron cluster-binding protein [Clostridiales bacterium]
MKILLSAQGDNKESLVDQRFGRAAYYIVYDDETNEYSSIENLGKFENSGAGVKASQFVLEQGVDCVITGSLGPKSFMIIQDAGLRGYKNFEGTVEEVLEAFKNNKLDELTTAGAEQKTRGGRY